MKEKYLLGQYILKESIIHKANIDLKLLLSFLLTIIAISISNLYVLIVLFFFIFAIFVLSKLNFFDFIYALKPLIFIIIFTVLFQVISIRSGHIIVSIGKFNLYSDALQFTIKVMLRFIILIANATLLLMTTPSTEIVEVIRKRLLKINFLNLDIDSFMITFSISLRFIPILLVELEKILNSNKSRGLDFRYISLFKKLRMCKNIISPLILIAINKSLELADAMEVRGF